MDLEILGSVVVLMLALAPFAFLLGDRRLRWTVLLGLLVLSGTAAAWCVELYRDPMRERASRPVVDRPIEQAHDDYVSSETCAACHPHSYATWHDSFHRTMTQEVTPDTVVADFEDQRLEHEGEAYRMFRRGEEYWVELRDPDFDGPRESAPRIERPLVLITGSHHFQAFWFASGLTRRLTLFPLCYRIDSGRWMPVDAAFLVPPNQHQSLDLGRWNIACNKCHATGVLPLVKSFEEMDTRVAEFGIACEMCHGPGGRHVEKHKDPLSRYSHHLSQKPDDTIVNPEKLDPIRASMACGQCHGVNELKSKEAYQQWRSEGLEYRPGDDLFETRIIRESDTQKFWSDGMIRVSGREYNGLLKSPCYTHGDEKRGILTCFSCHGLHPPEDDPRPIEEWRNDQLRFEMQGDEACLQCHGAFRDPQALTAHTHHAADSTGSSCYNCHMPHTTYGLLTAMRSHQISSPTVESTLRTGRPNACNLCHLDQTLEWAARNLEQWYSQPSFESLPVPEGMKNDFQNVALSVLWLLRGDAGQRAILTWHLSWEPARDVSGTDWMAPILSHLLADPYHSVRFLTGHTLCTLPGFENFAYDFMDSEASQRRAVDLAIEHWSQTRTDAAPPKTVLIDPEHRLLTHEIQRLLRMRNDRPVYLTE